MEAVFKAIRIDNGEWVEGFYFFDIQSGATIVETVTIPSFVCDHMSEPEHTDQYYHLVIPETICMFVTDRQDQRFFTNDLVKVSCDSMSEKLGHAIGEWTTKLIYDDKNTQFLLIDINNPKLEWGFDSADFNGVVFKKQVIGNFHD